MDKEYKTFDEWFTAYCERHGLVINYKTGKNHELALIAKSAWYAALVSRGN